jgi:6-pyruvoyltetrahydropterin/6-carboxytetrahydropterin synthase
MRFSAAHRLASARLSPAENRRRYGPCARRHGHDYALEVSVSGPVDARTGSILPRERLDEIVESRVIARFAHHLLNDDPLFEKRVPTAENLCEIVHEQLSGAIAETGARLVRVRVEETRRNSFALGELR